jgi:hypothetical protein
MKLKVSVFGLIAICALALAASAQVPVGQNTNGTYVYSVPSTPAIQEDFCGATPSTTTTIGDYGWDLTQIVGTLSTSGAVASVANHPCLVALTTTTTATQGVYLSLGHAVGILFPGNTTNWQTESIMEVNQISTGSYRVGFGTVDSITAIPTNGVYFRFLNGTDTFINACSDSAGVESCTPTSVAPTAGDWVQFWLTSNVSGTVIFKVVDTTTPASSTVTVGAAGSTLTATLPTVVLSPMFDVVETGGSVADVYTVDFYSYQQVSAR